MTYRESSAVGTREAGDPDAKGKGAGRSRDNLSCARSGGVAGYADTVRPPGPRRRPT